MSKEQLLNQIPPNLIAGIDRYLEHGYQPGGFLSAVLENDLIAAFERADDQSKEALGSLVTYLYNYIPMAAWGSPERVIAWTEHVRSGKLNSQATQHGDHHDAQREELR